VRADRVGEDLAVRRVAHRARGAHADPLDAERARPATEGGEHVDRACERHVVEAAGGVDALPEPRDPHVSGELRRLAGVGARFEDEEPAGVRPLIDRRDPTGSISVHRQHSFGDPRADGIVAAGELVGEMRVEAFEPTARAADASPCRRVGEIAGAISRIPLVRRVDRRCERRVGVIALVQAGDRPF
jgi:hypothetical protein